MKESWLDTQWTLKRTQNLSKQEKTVIEKENMTKMTSHDDFVTENKAFLPS